MKNTTKTSKVGFLLVALLGLLFVSCATHPAPTASANNNLVDLDSLVVNADGSISRKEVEKTGYLTTNIGGKSMRFKRLEGGLWADASSPKNHYRLIQQEGSWVIAPVVIPETKTRYTVVKKAPKKAPSTTVVAKKKTPPAAKPKKKAEPPVVAKSPPVTPTPKTDDKPPAEEVVITTPTKTSPVVPSKKDGIVVDIFDH